MMEFEIVELLARAFSSIVPLWYYREAHYSTMRLPSASCLTIGRTAASLQCPTTMGFHLVVITCYCFAKTLRNFVFFQLSARRAFLSVTSRV